MTQTPSVLGGLLLVIGNVIGAGILALPIATAQLGLPLAITLLLFFWLLMMLGAYYFLEVNLALPTESNLISMSRLTLGKPGVFVAWSCNLLVMYSLISAYLSGGGDLLQVNFQYINMSLPVWAYPTAFLLILGFVISKGMHITDHVNRIFMGLKAIIFIGIAVGLATHFNYQLVPVFPENNLAPSLLMVAVSSFGFATIIPSLRHYYQSDVKKIKKIIWWGTCIPLACYILWITLIFAVLPYEGDYGLHEMSQSAHPVSDLQRGLSEFLHIEWITQAMNIFSFICIITSFLVNSISLTDFLADGLNLYKNGQKRWSVYLIAYLPALCVVLFFPQAFLFGLSIAGTLAIIQLLILPGCMAWFLRYANPSARQSSYTVAGGKVLLAMLLVSSMALLLISVLA